MFQVIQLKACENGNSILPLNRMLKTKETQIIVPRKQDMLSLDDKGITTFFTDGFQNDHFDKSTRKQQRFAQNLDSGYIEFNHNKLFHLL